MRLFVNWVDRESLAQPRRPSPSSSSSSSAPVLVAVRLVVAVLVRAAEHQMQRRVLAPVGRLQVYEHLVDHPEAQPGDGLQFPLRQRRAEQAAPDHHVSILLLPLLGARWHVGARGSERSPFQHTERDGDQDVVGVLDGPVLTMHADGEGGRGLVPQDSVDLLAELDSLIGQNARQFAHDGGIALADGAVRAGEFFVFLVAAHVQLRQTIGTGHDPLRVLFASEQAPRLPQGLVIVVPGPTTGSQRRLPLLNQEPVESVPQKRSDAVVSVGATAVDVFHLLEQVVEQVRHRADDILVHLRTALGPHQLVAQESILALPRLLAAIHRPNSRGQFEDRAAVYAVNPSGAQLHALAVEFRGPDAPSNSLTGLQHSQLQSRRRQPLQSLRCSYSGHARAHDHHARRPAVGHGRERHSPPRTHALNALDALAALGRSSGPPSDRSTDRRNPVLSV
uniref:Polyamine oxidase n=1 Tax=Marchantia polymorpha TaxID=3197 RepID=A0A0M4UT91_MARPO|nr:polyamine oxidase [Marchantia polymorpha]